MTGGKRTVTLSAFRASVRLLGTRRFGTFWFASLLSSIGTWAQLVAEPWLLLTLGASSFLLGLDSFAMNAPVWLLTLAGGWLADHADRRRVITLFQSIQMLCPTAIIVLLLLHRIHPATVIGLSVIVGVTDALSMPSFQSIVPAIVSRDEIGAGLALNATQFNLSRILGPTIAGVLMSGVGVLACFAASALSYLPFIGVALWILPRRGRHPSTRDAPPEHHLLAGIGTILRRTELRGALLTVTAGAVLCGPLITFIPVLVRSVFHGGPAAFSIAVAAFGVGGLLGGGGLLAVGPGAERRRISTTFAVLQGAAIVATALTPVFALVPLLLIGAGAAMTVTNTAANALLQTAAEPHLLGRTVSLYMLAMRGGIALGALLTGVSVSLLGVRSALLIDGVAAIVLQVGIGWWWWLQPSGSSTATGS